MNITKYSASGNDFIIFHSFIKRDRSSLAKKLCNRFEGVGADGLIVLIPHKEVDFEWQFYNSDGSEAEMCGNGSRATAHYAFSNGLTTSNKMSFMTKAGVIKSVVEKDIVETLLTDPIKKSKKFKEEGFEWEFYDTGVPHLVTFVEDLNLYSREVASKMRYKYNANVNFAKIVDGKIYVRTYERGVEDETLACGTGMASSFYVAFLNKKVENRAFVYPKSGEELSLRFENGKLYFKGAVKKIFKTDIEGVL